MVSCLPAVSGDAVSACEKNSAGTQCQKFQEVNDNLKNVNQDLVIFPIIILAPVIIIIGVNEKYSSNK